MGILVKQAIMDMNEALVMEGLGASIDLMPDGATLSLDPDEEIPGVWLWKLEGSIYNRDIPLFFFFYTDQAMSLQFIMASQGVAPHDLTDEEMATLEEAFEWLFNEGAFDALLAALAEEKTDVSQEQA